MDENLRQEGWPCRLFAPKSLVARGDSNGLNRVIITNKLGHGGGLDQHFFKNLNSSATERVQMISGYVGKESIIKLQRELQKNSWVAVELVIGMAAKEGLSLRTYEALIELHKHLQSRRHPKYKRQGVFVYFSGPKGERARGMHAKAYRFEQSRGNKVIIGSSNFSFSGLSLDGNVEMNLADSSAAVTREFARFFDELHAKKHAVPIDRVEDFPIRGKAGQSRRNKLKTLAKVRAPKAGQSRRNKLPTLVKVRAPTGYKSKQFVDIDLARNIDRQSRSNLNCCFGKGRWSRATGVVKLRDWYEVELISSADVTSNRNYPRGEFGVLTSDGFAFRGVTNGDNYKNFRSADDLKLLGLWLKGVLEDAGVLSDDPQELVTSETLEDYGNSVLRIYRPNSRSVILHFPRDPKDL